MKEHKVITTPQIDDLNWGAIARSMARDLDMRNGVCFCSI
jgi:hypothetical protein